MYSRFCAPIHSGNKMASTVLTDVSGLPVVCSSQEALDHFNKGLLALVTLNEPPVPHFKRAVEVEPTFILGSAMLVSCSTRLAAE